MASCNSVNNNLSITTTNDHFVCVDSSNGLNAFGTGIYIESKGFVFYLESEEIAALRTGEEIVLSVLAESHA